MTYPLYLYILAIAAFIALFPVDSQNAVALAALWVKVLILNYYLMFRAYLMYRQMKSDLAKIGVPFPAFKFVPIWERDGFNKKN